MSWDKLLRRIWHAPADPTVCRAIPLGAKLVLMLHIRDTAPRA